MHARAHTHDYKALSLTGASILYLLAQLVNTGICLPNSEFASD